MSPRLDLDLVLLHSSKQKEVVAHILHLLQLHQPITVCRALLQAVEAELLLPRVFSIFLSATKDTECLLTCLRQTFSTTIRNGAIKQYGKALADADRWEAAWTGLGSVNGVLEYLSTVSVNEVSLFCSSVGLCNTRGVKIGRRAAAMEDLAKALNPSLYPDSSFRTSDKRPLDKFAARLLPSCSSGFVAEAMDVGTDGSLYNACRKAVLLKSHHNLVKDRTIQALQENKSKYLDEDIRLYVTRLTSSVPSSVSNEEHFSSSMKFSEWILNIHLKDKAMVWPETPSAADIYISLLHRCTKHRISKGRLHEIMDLGMQLLASNSALKTPLQRHQNEFWLAIVKNWSKWPNHWTDLFTRGIQLGLAGSRDAISDSFLRLHNLTGSKQDDAWPLLRLLCLHLTRSKIDINEREDMGSLSKQHWNYNLFEKLSDSHKLHLLQSLLHHNKTTRLLNGTPPNSIISQQAVPDGPSFGALAYLTAIRLRGTNEKQRIEASRRMMKTCEELKQNAASSREQEDRAKFAKAAGFYAIASGSLELFDQHVTWLARYVRDPLTLKVVFGQASIGFTETAELLSGIPLDLNNTKLADIAKQVSHANAIMLKFQEHHDTAKREPSYKEYDWTGVGKLLEETVNVRITRAAKLQEYLTVSQGELYVQLWRQTIAMVFQMGSASMMRLQGPLSNLFSKFPPKLLATVTQHLLEIDNEYRATKAKGKKSEDSSRVIENLIYGCLLNLADSENPTLASEVIVQVVIERPDASSWHRQLLGLGFFKRLPARDAEGLLLKFAQAIGEKLEEQSFVRIGEAPGAPSIVKVTTVKYLAQLLQNAQFLSQEAAIDTLVELFKSASHPDIKKATLDSMLWTMNELAATEVDGTIHDISEVSNPLIRRILLALDAVLPVVSSINERRPPKEQDWIEAEEDLSKLPNPSAHTGERPIWTALLNAAETNKGFKPYFVKNLLLPSLKASILEHRKWLMLFLKKHKADFSIDRLPPGVPSDIQMIRVLLTKFSQYLPREILAAWNTYLKFMLQQPIFLSRFAHSLLKDEEKNSQADVIYFLSIFNRTVDATVSNGTTPLVNMLHHIWEPSLLPGKQGIDLSQIQEAILEQMEILLHHYDKNVSTWNSLITSLRHPTVVHAEFKKWETDCRPILHQVIAMIDNTRTTKWINDPNRQPSILPSTLRPRLWELDCPQPGWTGMESELKYNTLARDIIRLIKEQLEPRKRTYDIERLVKDVLTVTEKLSAQGNLQVGLSIGTLMGAEDEEVQVICAKASLGFLLSGKAQLAKNANIRIDITNMIKRWKRSFVEEVREAALDLMTNGSYGRLWEAIIYRQD